ncbi:MAG: hypothetical protein RIS54_1451 [Verrucomicrobiota bacterium]|jgi:hypothetical protein
MKVSKPTSDRVGFAAKFAGLSAATGANTLRFHYRGLPVDQVISALKSTKTTLKGGTIDIATEGTYDAATGNVDLPLTRTIHDTTLSLNGRDTKVSRFSLPIGVTGSLDNPRIKVDAKSLGDLALQAGKDALKEKAAGELKGKAGGLLDGLLRSKK